MATLQELMAEVLGNGSTTGQEKTASATKPSTSEVDQVLENLGLQGAETVKTASATEESRKNGGTMGLMDIYEQVMGNAPEAVQEKTAAAAGASAAAAEGASDASTAFGELVGEYFNEIAEPYFGKVASDLETEAGKGEQPLAHVQTGGSMASALGKPADPALPKNHSASSGAPLHVAVHNSTPYALREAALKKAILRRATVEAPKVVD